MQNRKSYKNRIKLYIYRYIIYIYISTKNNQRHEQWNKILSNFQNKPSLLHDNKIIYVVFIFIYIYNGSIFPFITNRSLTLRDKFQMIQKMSAFAPESLTQNALPNSAKVLQIDFVSLPFKRNVFLKVTSCNIHWNFSQ